MTLTSNGQSQHRIPLSPSISTTRQARERLIEIDHEAVAALGRSEVSVKEYVRPRGFHAVVFWLSAITFVLMSRRQNLAPGSILYASVLHHLPTFARFLQTIRPYVIGFMLVAHSVEAVIMARTRLRKHTVPDGSLLWWTWIMSTFVEGFGAFQRYKLYYTGSQSRAITTNFYLTGLIDWPKRISGRRSELVTESSATPY